MMDPNETLRRLRAACRREHDLITQSAEEEYIDTGDLIEVTNEVVELAEALDEWLAKGGFPPAEWPRRHTDEDVRTMVNAAANEVEAFADLPDEGARDAMNLLVNIVGHRLTHPDASVEDVIVAGYEAEPDDVRSWVEAR